MLMTMRARARARSRMFVASITSYNVLLSGERKTAAARKTMAARRVAAREGQC